MGGKTVNYEKIITQSPNGVISTDDGYIIKYFNASAERLTGLTKGDVMNQYFFDVFPQMKPFRDSLDEYKINRIQINNSSLCVRFFENHEHDEKGITGKSYVFIMHDFYEAISLTTELEKMEQIMSELQEIIEGSFDGILVTDGDANVLMVNQSYVRNTDIQKEELIGHNMRELINPVWMKNSVALLAIEQRQPVTMHHTTRHGRNIMVTGMPVFGPKGNIKKVIINSRDISEIYELREELSKAKEMEKIYFQLNKEEDQSNTNDDLVMADAKMKEIFSLAKRISNFNTTVLITGESGAGKEVIAKYIHDESVLRKEKPFIAVNCGAIPENLLESELFGYQEGAFTGAVKGGKAGLFEAANEGTLFLDEIGEMSLNLQVKLLRALETRTINRIGSSKEIPVDIRIIAATHRDLGKMVEEGLFREDLFYRLNVVSLEIPPLRERKEDIPLLAMKFIKQFNHQYEQTKKFTYEVMKEMESYAWPGNIRQLKNVIESMVVVSKNEYLQLNDLPWVETNCLSQNAHEFLPLQESVDLYEKQLLLEAKNRYVSTRKMAEALQVNQSTIVRKLKKYGIE